MEAGGELAVLAHVMESSLVFIGNKGGGEKWTLKAHFQGGTDGTC